VVLYLGAEAVPLGDGVRAVPVTTLWS
jgi:hypothetical protein